MRNIGPTRLALLAAAMAVAALLGSPAPALGASFTVNATHDAVDASPGDGVCADAGGACTLRAAVMETNALPGADEISLPAGTYVLSIPGAGEDASATGDLDVTDDLTLTGAGRDTTVIDAGGLDRVIHVLGSIGMNAQNLLLTNGSAGTSAGGGKCNPFAGQENGGGLCNESGVVQLSNISISESSATRHGAAIWNAGVVEVESSLIVGNIQEAVINGDNFNEGTATLRSTSVNDNGRGLRNYGTAILENSVFNGNLNGVENWGGTLTMDGGEVNSNDQLGLLNFGDKMTLSGVTVHGNGSLGIDNEMPGQLVVIGSTISNNAGTGVSSSVGQPVDTPLVPGSLAMTNSTVSGNLEGGIITGGDMVLLNVTIAHNTGPGVSRDDRPFPITTTLANTIVANGTGPNCSGSITSLGHNLDSDGTCGLSGPGDLSGVGEEAGLLPLADNGGPTQTHALLLGGCQGDACVFGSIAIDAGDNSSCPATDQRGVLRPEDGDGRDGVICDIGAFELEGPPPVPCPAGQPCPSVGPVTPTPTSPPPTATPTLPLALPQTGGRPGHDGMSVVAVLATLPALLGAAALSWRIARRQR